MRLGDIIEKRHDIGYHVERDARRSNTRRFGVAINAGSAPMIGVGRN